MPSSLAHALIAAKSEFQSALLEWYRDNARVLPWRTEPSAYKTVVSEFMLQQTQVKTVLPYFARWLNELPDFTALAAAPEAKVLKLWEGLGYYSRARNLHRLGRALAALPTLPQASAEWLKLPGVGPYTAAAVTSIAFNQPAACVDGNVVRILARLTADGSLYRDSASAAKAFAPLAQALLSPANPGDHNQAMMELGATVCTRAKPLCLTCPVRRFCAAAARGEPESFPKLAPKVIERRALSRVWAVENDALLLHRASTSARRLAELHELPTIEHVAIGSDFFATQTPLVVRKRGITRFQFTESIYAWTPTRKSFSAELVWVPLAEIDQISLSGPHRRWITEILAAK
jgi:A/G-specific adenine glycosylase